MKRIDLGDGKWADVLETCTHGEDKALRRAYIRGRTDPAYKGEWDTMLARVFVMSWNLVARDGTPLPTDRVVDPEYRVALVPAEIIEAADAGTLRVLCEQVADIYIGATVPNAPTPPSSDDSSSEG